MALTSWGANNLVIEQDYGIRFNSIEVGQPEVTIELSGNQPTASVKTWWHGMQEETARWRYVGMDYSTAKSCADGLRTALTFSKQVWGFGSYLSGTTLLYGYYSQQNAPQLESDVALEKNGNGEMYDVVVDAKATNDYYSSSSHVSLPGTAQLANYLNTVQGWNTYKSGWSNGKSISAASANNLVIVVAPTRTREFEIAGNDIYNPSGTSLSSITFPIWYKCTDTYRCQLKYTGMTLGACRTLRSTLNNTTGWYLETHPYEYKYDAQWHTFHWEPNTQVTNYQCLNEFKAVKGDGNMWTVELNLHAEDVQYVNNTSYASQWSWPTLWSSIPGLTAYL